jgi:drug/metabolite transporter (DMT)-like permease
MAIRFSSAGSEQIMTSLAAYFLALFGNFLLSLGFSLQKKYVSWLSAKRRGVRIKRGEIIGWLSGFTLMNLQPIFNYLALGKLAPNIVAAIGGSNIVFTIILSYFLLGERIPAGKIPWIALMAGSLALAGFVGQESSKQFQVEAFWTAFFIPTGFAMLVLLANRKMTPAQVGIFLGSAAGALGGFMVLALEALRMTRGSDFMSWIFSPYLYVYIFCGISSFSIKQVAFERGRMAAVAPSFYGLLVLYPSIATYFVSSVPLHPQQILALLGISVSIILISL